MENPLNVLKKYWGYPDFRGQQAEIIHTILSGRDVVGILPTGAGKSICYQIPGLCFEGITLVISPLIALMQDQVDQLKKRNIPAAFIHSGMSSYQIDAAFDNCIFGHTKFLYISPERIQSYLFHVKMKDMNVSLIAVDEAHCISEWGHDFRPAYRQLLTMKEWFPNAQCCAFTATANSIVADDILQNLPLKNPKIFSDSFVKETCLYTVLQTKNKSRELVNLLQRLPGAGLIYSKSRKQTEELTVLLELHGFNAAYYHGGMDSASRKAVQERWLEDKSLIIVCTNAFGMGIDKPDVRYVIHMEVPNTMEAYYQEAGRAGRDRLQAYSIVLFNKKDVKQMISMFENTQVHYDEVVHFYDVLCRQCMIAVGECPVDPVNVDYEKLINTLGWSIRKMQGAFRILEKSNFLEVNDAIYHESKVQIKINKQQIFEWTDSDSKVNQALTHLLRTYEGIMHRPISILEDRLATFLDISNRDAVELLRALQGQGIIRYQERSDRPLITFLAPRPDSKNLGLDKKGIVQYWSFMKDRLNYMIDFVRLDACRENMILHYFGEQRSSDCGHCDICLGSHRTTFTNKEYRDVYERIQSCGERDIFVEDFLFEWSYILRKRVVNILAHLEDEEIISITNGKIVLN